MMKITLSVCFLTILMSLTDCSHIRELSPIYVNSKSGNDKYPGTQEKPLKSIAAINNHLTKKTSGIRFAACEVFNGTLNLKGIECPESAGFIIGSYGNGKACVNGGDNEGILLENCRNILIENLEFKGNGRKGGNTTNGLQMVDCTDCIVKSIIASGFQKSGIDLFNCRSIVVINVYTLNNGFSGINVMGSEKKMSGRILIKDCKAENNPGDPSILDNHSGNGILIGVSDSVMVDHCTAVNNGWDMPRQGNGPVGIWAWESNNVTIQYCISYRNKTSKGGKDGGGFDLDGGVTNSTIQYCLSYENQGAGYGLFQYSGASPWLNNTVRYCVSINDALMTDGAGSLFIWNGSGTGSQLSGCKIYNNVVYNSSAPLISFENSSEHRNFIFFNNIFIGTEKPVIGKNSGSLFTGNIWWGGDHELIHDLNRIEGTSDGLSKGGTFPRIPDSVEDPYLKGPFHTEIADPYKMNDLIGFQIGTNSPLRNRGLDFNRLPGDDWPVLDFYGHMVPLGIGTEPGICEID
jgi:hypothetical protein